MESEFRRERGNLAVSTRGFEVEVSGGMGPTITYRDLERQASIPAEMLTTGGIGLFMDWARFPDGSTGEEQREIFERVVSALRFMNIRIEETEIDPSKMNWPLPPSKDRT